MIPSNNYGFTWSKHKKRKVTNSWGSHPVIVCKLRQNVPLKSFRTGPWGVKVWHNVMSLSWSVMYNIHGGSCWTDQFLCTSDDEKPLKVDMVKHISSPKGKDNPFQRQRVCFKHTHIFFRQWKSTFVDGDSGAMLLCHSDAAALNCSWRLSTSTTEFTWWTEKNTNTARFPLWLGKGQKRRCRQTSTLTMSVFSASWVRISLIFVAFVVSVVSHGGKKS